MATDDTTEDSEIKLQILAQRWTVLGCACLGLIIGFMTGMSVSPVVGVVIGLIFAFTGGSVIVLIKGRATKDLILMGKSISALSVAVTLGVVVGVMAREGDWLHSNPSMVNASYRYEGSLSVDDIIEMHNDKIDKTVIQTLLRVTYKKDPALVMLSKNDLKKLSDAKVPSSVMKIMLLGGLDINQRSPSPPTRTKLFSFNPCEDNDGNILGRIEGNI